jgi:hypothetical protein
VAYVLVCETWYSSFTSDTIKNQYFAMEFIRAEDKELQQMQHQLVVSHNATDYRLLLTTFLDLRFVIKFMYSPTIEKIDGGEGLNSRFGPSSNNSLLFLPFFCSTYA